MKDLEPKGEALRRAVRWIGEQRRDNPTLKLTVLVDEAAKRFDLSPADENFLWLELVPRGKERT